MATATDLGKFDISWVLNLTCIKENSSLFCHHLFLEKFLKSILLYAESINSLKCYTSVKIV